MKINYLTKDVMTDKSDFLILPLLKKSWKKNGLLVALDEKLDGLLLKALRADSFDAGKYLGSYAFQTWGKLPFERILLVGLGDKKLGADMLWDLAYFVSKQLRLDAVKKATMLCDFEAFGVDSAKALQQMVLGLRMGDYRFEQYLSRNKRSDKLSQFTFFGDEKLSGNAAKKAILDGQALADGIDFTRDLVNTTAEQMTPAKLASEASKMAKEMGLQIKVESEAAIKKRKMGLYLAVARASAEPPKLITVTYNPPRSAKVLKPLVLVGKGVTYDSGGLSLKPTAGMATMKCDMAGSAAVLGAMKAIGALKPKRQVIAIVAACENMPGGKSYKVGDVFTAANGLSVEVLNTDAEGRLTLADALVYANSFKPAKIVDVATLTGACVVALGEYTAAAMGNDEKFVGEALDAAKEAGEDFWQMPLNPKLKKLLKSDIADMKNVGSRWGGAIIAGLFLEEFVDETPWVHMDIAGPAFLESEAPGHLPKGATGFGVATLVELAKK